MLLHCISLRISRKQIRGCHRFETCCDRLRDNLYQGCFPFVLSGYSSFIGRLRNNKTFCFATHNVYQVLNNKKPDLVAKTGSGKILLVYWKFVMMAMQLTQNLYELLWNSQSQVVCIYDAYAVQIAQPNRRN